MCDVCPVLFFFGGGGGEAQPHDIKACGLRFQIAPCELNHDIFDCFFFIFFCLIYYPPVKSATVDYLFNNKAITL